MVPIELNAMFDPQNTCHTRRGIRIRPASIHSRPASQGGSRKFSRSTQQSNKMDASLPSGNWGELLSSGYGFNVPTRSVSKAAAVRGRDRTPQEIINDVYQTVSCRAGDEQMVIHRMTRQFRTFDSDQSGSLDKSELRECLRKYFAIEMNENENDSLYRYVTSFDENNDGSVDILDFVQAFKPRFGGKKPPPTNAGTVSNLGSRKLSAAHQSKDYGHATHQTTQQLLTAISNRLRWQSENDSDLVRQLTMTFRKMDVGERGYLTEDQLATSLKRDFAMKMTYEQNAQVFAALDVNRDGKLDKREFIKGLTAARDGAGPKTFKHDAFTEHKFVKYAAANGCGHRFQSQARTYPARSWAYTRVPKDVHDHIVQR
jgi:Ca2+-binding EF-hand superfamily protein